MTDRDDMTIHWNLHVLLDEHRREARDILNSDDENAIAKEHQMTDDYADKIIALFWKRGLLVKLDIPKKDKDDDNDDDEE